MTCKWRGIYENQASTGKDILNNGDPCCHCNGEDTKCPYYTEDKADKGGEQ